ncbi:MAG: hypothetical protein C4334_08255 [Pyrinomonas sp.]
MFCAAPEIALRCAAKSAEAASGCVKFFGDLQQKRIPNLFSCIYSYLDNRSVTVKKEGAMMNIGTAAAMSLEERLKKIDHIQARRYAKLSGLAREIATEGILRHLRACDRMDVNPDVAAVREIIDDALNGRRVFAEPLDDRYAA